MLNLSIKCTRFESNYSNCTRRSGEYVFSSCGGAQEKGNAKTSLGPGYLVLVKFHSHAFDALLC